jgi:hypothetical protein
MKKTIALLCLALLLFVPFKVQAQTETPPQPEAAFWVGEVTGSLLNRSDAAKSSGVVEIMLHAWDENFNEKMMLHGETAEDGTFRFEGVEFQLGVLYAVMVTYQGVIYFSEPQAIEEGQDSLEIQVPIYETTSDLAAVSVDQMHVLFFFSQGGLGVTEVFILSNRGDRTVNQVVTLEEGEHATLQFSLPPDAANVTFNTRAAQRFIQFPGGFADTEPLLPGEGTGQIMVSYILPYEDGQTFEYQATLPTKQINFLLDATSGVELTGDDLVSKGVQSMQDGSSFAIFRHAEVQPGSSVQVQLSGTPQVVVASEAGSMGEPEGSPSTTSRQGLAVGGIVLGLTLVGVGIWWFRKPEEEGFDLLEEDSRGQSMDEIIQAIVGLEQAHEQGELEEEEYQRQRGELRQRAKALLAETE